MLYVDVASNSRISLSQSNLDNHVSFWHRCVSCSFIAVWVSRKPKSPVCVAPWQPNMPCKGLETNATNVQIHFRHSKLLSARCLVAPVSRPRKVHSSSMCNITSQPTIPGPIRQSPPRLSNLVSNVQSNIRHCVLSRNTFYLVDRNEHPILWLVVSVPQNP